LFIKAFWVVFLTFLLLFITPLSYEPLVNLQPDPVKHGQFKNVHFVFINGLGCRSNGSCYGDMGFENIRRSLGELGYSYYDDRFLLYSYKGGRMVDGRWCPEKYSPGDTSQPIFFSVNMLRELVEKYSAAHPDAAFILVGHSLGGRVALDFITKAPPKIREKIKGVITLNSPLLGAGKNVPPAIIAALEVVDSIWADPAVRQLLYETEYRRELNLYRRETIRELRDEGVRIATFSFYRDFFVPPLTACVMDENNKPCTEGFIINPVSFSIKDLSGHMRILERPEIVNYIYFIYQK